MTSCFAQDILPLFRSQDIACMTPRGIRLNNAEWMCDPAGNDEFGDHANAQRVFGTLERGVMPPGARWPQAKLDIYQNWMTNGFQP